MLHGGYDGWVEAGYGVEPVEITLAAENSF